MVKIGITERGDAALDQSWRRKLDTVSGAVLITKAPHKIGEIPANCLVHCTITGFGGTVLEPGVATPSVTIPAYHEILDKIGPERAILRIDPIILTHKGLQTATDIFQEARGRVRISFMDNYRHVGERFREAGLPQLKTDGLHYPLNQRLMAVQLFPESEVCGEPGLNCTGCISGRDLAAIGLDPTLAQGKSSQRAACLCISGKTELLSNRNPCSHNCLYCYWRS